MKPIKLIVLIFIIIVISANHLYSEIYGSVSGIVTDEDTGKGISGVIVNMSGRENKEGITDSNGKYQIKLLKPAEYIVLFGTKLPHCSISLESILIEPGKNYVYNKILKKGGAIKGRVLNSDRKTPISGVYIYTYSKFAGAERDNTKEDGSFYLGDFGRICPSDNYYLRAEYPDPGVAYKNVIGIKVEKGNETNINDIIFDLNDPTGIEGIVTSSIDGKCLSNVSVYIESADKLYPGTNDPLKMGEVETDINGYYSIKNLEPGRYTITFLPKLEDGMTIDDFEESEVIIENVTISKGEKRKIDTKLNCRVFETGEGEINE